MKKTGIIFLLMISISALSACASSATNSATQQATLDQTTTNHRNETIMDDTEVPTFDNTTSAYNYSDGSVTTTEHSEGILDDIVPDDTKDINDNVNSVTRGR